MKEGERVASDFTGTMIDREGWQLRRIAAGDLGVIRNVMNSDESVDRDMREKLVAGLTLAARDGEVWGQARAYRVLAGAAVFDLGPDEASAMTQELRMIVAARWQPLFKEAGLSPADQGRFATCFRLASEDG